MAPSLPDLPAELLLKIIESDVEPEEHPYLWYSSITPSKKQKFMYIALRSTCREINAKVVYFFGSKYFRTVRFKVDQTNLVRLQAISQGTLGVHVQSIEADVSTLLEYETVETDAESTDASPTIDSWYSTQQQNIYEIWQFYFSFNEDVVDFVASGACDQILSQAMAAFHNLKTFTIRPPDIMGRMKEVKMRDLLSRWLLVSKTLLSCALSHGVTLEALVTERDPDEKPLPVPLSALDSTMIGRLQSSLRKLQLDLDIDVNEGE
jgi:hypothetical protein